MNTRTKDILFLILCFIALIGALWLSEVISSYYHKSWHDQKRFDAEEERIDHTHTPE